MGERIDVMISEEELDSRIRQIGEQISRDFAGESVFLAVVLRGASFFGCELAKRITVPVTIDFLSTSSYGSGTTSSGQVKLKQELGLSVEGQNLIVVEDIIDSGHTLKFLSEYFRGHGAKTVRLCSMLDKPDRREVTVDMDYTGFTIPDEFVVGYGLDYDQKYRNLPYVGKVVFD